MFLNYLQTLDTELGFLMGAGKVSTMEDMSTAKAPVACMEIG
jgi:hypothetical protein